MQPKADLLNAQAGTQRSHANYYDVLSAELPKKIKGMLDNYASLKDYRETMGDVAEQNAGTKASGMDLAWQNLHLYMYRHWFVRL